MKRGNTIDDNALYVKYKQGFTDYLDGIYNKKLLIGIIKKAYILGRLSAEAGDDVTSIDLLNKKDILKLIKSK